MDDFEKQCAGILGDETLDIDLVGIIQHINKGSAILNLIRRLYS